MQFAQPARHLVEGGSGWQVEYQGPHLGPQEVIRARRTQRGQPRVLGPGDEVEHHLGVGVVADLRPVGAGQAADERSQFRGAGQPLGLGQCQGIFATRSPKHSAVSFSPSAAVASAIPESGCRWSTCGALTSPCIAVSIDGAAPPLPCRQKSNAATISSSRSTPG